MAITPGHNVGPSYYDDDDDDDKGTTGSNNYSSNANANTTNTNNPATTVFNDNEEQQRHRSSCFDDKYLCCLGGSSSSSCCCCCCLPKQRNKTNKSMVGLSTTTTGGLIVSLLIYWSILYVLAASYNPGDRRFTLTVGDTWRVQPPHNLWSRTSLSIQAIHDTSTAAQLEVYEFLPVLDYSQPARCPPLTLGNTDENAGGSMMMNANSNSPMVTLHESATTIRLGMNEYQYEDFHLNQGSVLSISAQLVEEEENKNNQNHNATTATMDNSHKNDVQQQQHRHDGMNGGLGATNIYILQGYHALQELETRPNNIDVTGIENFRGRSIEKRYMSYAGSAAELQYTIPTSDYYIVVYENAAPRSTTNVKVTLTVHMATHYLSDVARPICSTNNTSARQKNGCAWIFNNDQDRQRVASTCIIAKAISPQLTRQIQNQTTIANGEAAGSPNFDVSVEASQTVIVQVHAPLGSTRLVLLAVAPLLVVLIVWFLENGQRCLQHVRRKACFFRRRRQGHPNYRMGKDNMMPPTDERSPLNKRRF